MMYNARTENKDEIPFELYKEADGARTGRTLFWGAKRVFDLVTSCCCVLILSPLFIFIIALIKLTSKGPAFYKHKRIGKNGKPIEIYKFRSMVENADQMIDSFTDAQKAEWQQNFKLENDPRVTRVGKILRATSMDELPQFFNIIRGDIALIGPRPVVEEELERYGAMRSKLLSVTPGLTGYWQAYARSECSYEKRIEMELYYVDHACVALDIRIFFATIARVLRRKGAM